MLEEETIQGRIKILYDLGHNSVNRLMTHQLTNHLITASVGRFDDDHFNGMVWIKDGVRAVKFALDPNFQQAFPQLTKPAKSLYLSSVRALLQIQAQPAQLWRFQNRPSIDAGNGYVTIDDRQAPAIKFTQDGLIYHDWGHNQPDNWGTLLLEVGKGIEAGWPVLEKGQNQAIPLGSIMQEVTSYVVGLRTERLVCRSIWEHKKAWSSYSTRRIVLAGLEKTEQIWPELITDSRKRAYPLKVTRQQLEDAIGRLREKVKEHFPADYTDSEGHESSADLASIVVLNDIDLPDDESSEILERARELENRQGFYRYLGDPWKQGRAEAKWTMGKPIMARYYFRLARRLYEQGKAREAYRSLGRGLDKIDDMIAIINTYGYIPEIFEDRQKDGVYRPNNNELAWTHGDIIEATSAGIVALETSERFYQKVA